MIGFKEYYIDIKKKTRQRKGEQQWEQLIQKICFTKTTTYSHNTSNLRDVKLGEIKGKYEQKEEKNKKERDVGFNFMVSTNLLVNIC